MTTTTAIPTTPSTLDTRRIGEHDADFVRLHTATVKRLTASLARYARELRSGERDPQHVASDFITRHIGILSTRYQQAYKEGQRDWYVPRSRTPGKWVQPPDRTKLRQRLAFYAAASVAKMAREGMEAAQGVKQGVKPVKFASSEAPVTLDEDALDEWQGGAGIRLELQGQLTWTGLQDGYNDAGANDPANPYRWLFWDLEPFVRTQHCGDCPPLADGSPYDPPWMAGGNILTTVPGAGATECGAGCKCSLRYGSALEATVANNWKSYTAYLQDLRRAGLLDVERAFQRAIMMPLDASSAESAESESENAPPERFVDSMTALFEPETLAGYAGSLGGAPENDPLYQQQAAQDAYRSVWNAWDIARGDLPQMPRLAWMFSNSEPGADGETNGTMGQPFDITQNRAVSFEQFIDALPDWELQTPERQQLLRRWVEAILRLGGADLTDGE